MFLDLGLQVLDNVILTRWKVLPKEQCQGEDFYMDEQQFILLTPRRYPKFRGQFYYRMLQFGTIVEVAENTPQQAQLGPGFYSKARMASQLAYLHQRDHLVMPHKLVDLRKQYGHSAIAIRGGFRLFS